MHKLLMPAFLATVPIRRKSATMVFMGEHEIGQRIIDTMEESGFWHEEFTHEPVRTSEDAAKLRHHYTLAQGAKAIIIRAKIPNVGKKFVMLVMPGDQKFDSNKVKLVVGSKDIRFATEFEVAEVTEGIQPGGVPPFGNLFGLAVYCDPSIFNNEKIIFNAGRDLSIAITSADYRTVVQPIVASII